MAVGISGRGRRKYRSRLAGISLCLALTCTERATAATPVDPAKPGVLASPDISPSESLAARIVASGDAAGQPFAIVDKQRATVLIFGGTGALRGRSPVLVGAARGDATVPGIGSRPLASILPSERTTPAGRFAAAMGTNAAGHRILWVDYQAAISMHAVVTRNPAEHRLERLASTTPADNRISYGCINVPTSFFNDVVAPSFEGAAGIVYILPEVRPLDQVFYLPALG